MKKCYASIFFVLMSAFGFAQKWADAMQDPEGNYYEIKRDFEEYWSTRDITEKGKGYKVFKRWEQFVESRVYPSGDLAQLQQTGPNFEAWLKANNSTPGKQLGSNNNLIASSTFTAMGPFGAISGSAGGQFLKSGRLNFITIHPTNTLNLWVGAPAGGLWNSTNGGSTWTTNTDQLSVTGCSDLVIDPTNTLVMYLATGDGDAGDTRSIGVLKSTNGGATWNPTGLTNNVTNNFLIRRLLINPSNTQIVIAACNNGIWRTTNGGTSWSQVNTQNTFDIEFKPGDPNIVYAGGTNFRISTNGGASFTQVSTGLPTSGIQRIALAVTPNNPNYVYILAASSANSGFLGLYRSTNSGTSFSTMSNSPNVLGWNSNGGDTGGQGWYDLCIAASPLNADEVVVGGVNVWRSLNGGSTWTIYGHWTGSGAPFTHADHHDLEYAPDGTLFNTNDGTVYRRTSSGWQEICGQMNISQIYKIGLSTLTANRWITGHQDNGTSYFTGTSYNAAIGGDGMDCFIDRTNNQNMFGETQNGGLRRSTNGGLNWTSCTGGLSGTAPWVTVWKQDPQTSSRLYVGLQNLFVSNNLATSNWSTLTALPATGSIREFAIAPSNNQVIYVLKSNGIYKTINGGTSWTTVTGSVPVSSALPEFITISPTDPNKAWVVLGGYSSGNKVYMTTNGGSTWTNYSANLPNIPANCCVFQPGSNDMIYVGMDVGIYYRNATSSTWTLYNTGLPNVPVSDMEFSAANGLLYAATYGRGVWAVSPYSAAGAPLSMFSFPTSGICAGASLTFTDQSTNTPNSWNWSVVPSTGVVINSSVSPSPVITFPTAGTYTVSLQASNSLGQGNVSSQVVTIGNAPNLNIVSSSPTVCTGGSLTLNVSGASSYTWSNGGGNSSSAVFFPVGTSIYSVAGNSGSCTTIKTTTIIGLPLPVISISGPNNVCAGDTAQLLAGGGSSYVWIGGSTANTLSVIPVVTAAYSVTGTDANGCSATAFHMVGVNPLPLVNLTAENDFICLGEQIQLNASGAQNYLWAPGSVAGPTILVSPSSDISYTCTGYDANGCANTNILTITVNVCESLSAYDHFLKLKVFPNPASNVLTIQSVDAKLKVVSVRIFDLSGRILLAETLNFENGAQVSVNISELAKGLYFLDLKDQKGNTDIKQLIKD